MYIYDCFPFPSYATLFIDVRYSGALINRHLIGGSNMWAAVHNLDVDNSKLRIGLLEGFTFIREHTYVRSTDVSDEMRERIRSFSNKDN